MDFNKAKNYSLKTQTHYGFQNSYFYFYLEDRSFSSEASLLLINLNWYLGFGQIWLKAVYWWISTNRDSPKLHKCYFFYMCKQILSKVPILLYFVRPKRPSGNYYVTFLCTENPGLNFRPVANFEHQSLLECSIWKFKVQNALQIRPKVILLFFNFMFTDDLVLDAGIWHIAIIDKNKN